MIVNEGQRRHNRLVTDARTNEDAPFHSCSTTLGRLISTVFNQNEFTTCVSRRAICVAIV
jgi:hypothetical protein